MDNLKYCPFCGETKDLERYVWKWSDGTIEGDYSVRCQNCGAIGPPCGTWKDAQLAWYERKP